MFGTEYSEDDLLAANVLPSRPSRPRDPGLERAAMDALVGRIHADPANALQALVETIVDLCGAGSCGVSILRGRDFVWPAFAGASAPFRGQGLPMDASPRGVVVERDATLPFDDPKQLFPNILVTPEFRELLLVPLRIDGAPQGTLWVVSHDDRRFDAEDARLLYRMGLFAAAIAEVGRLRANEVRIMRSARDRVRHTLSIFRSLIRSGARSDDDGGTDDMVQMKLSSRLAAYAEGAETTADRDSSDLWVMIAQLLAQHGEPIDGRISLTGEPVAIPAQQAGVVALAIHELIQNAFDHGALSTGGGQVDIRW